jgi:hypothetical protein
VKTSAFVTARLSLAVVTAGCGAGSHSPRVASLGDPAATTTTPSASPSGGSFGVRAVGGRKFSACMRAHGVPGFPDPDSQGAIAISPASGVDPRSAAFQAAQRHCSSLLPNGGRQSPEQQARMRAAALAMSACMRRHGLPSFPDPVFSNGGASVRITGGLDPQSPVFQGAQRACIGKLRGTAGGGK